MTTKDQDLETYGANLELSDTIGEFPKTLVKGGMRITVNNQKWYDAAIASGFTTYSLTDEWHLRLVWYLETLLECAKSWDFHDFATTTWMPKQNLKNQLIDLAQKTIDGEFDN